MKIYRITILFLLLLQLAVPCHGKKLNIVTTIPPVTAIAKDIIGDKHSVSTLIKDRQSIHDMYLSFSQVKKIHDADLMIWAGNKVEPYLEKLSKNNKLKHVDVSCSPGIKWLPQRHLSEKHSHHAIGNLDVHFWLDTDNAIKTAQFITRHLCILDKQNQNYYNNKLNEFINNTQKLRKDLALKFSNLDYKKYFVTHDAFQYFDKTISIEPIAAIFTNCQHNLTMKKIKELDDMCDKYNIEVIFAEKQLESNTVFKIARKHNIHIAFIDPLGQGTSYSNLLEDIANTYYKYLVK